MRPIGHSCVIDNICFDCGGELRSDDGSFSERHFDDGRKAFAAPICAYCKMVHAFAQEVGRVPDDFEKRVKHLRALPTEANYLVGLWSKAEQRNGQIVERRYTVNLNGTMATSYTTCDLNRSLKSFNSSGWQPHPIDRSKFRTRIALFEHVNAELTTRGYTRLI